MGKRAKKVTLKKMAKPKLETVFSCPLCSHEKCIECRMDRTKQIGTARCRVCTAGYQTVITYLSDPVDVYAEWVDVVAEREKAEASKGEAAVAAPSSDQSSEKDQSDELPILENILGKRRINSEKEKKEQEKPDNLPNRDTKKENIPKSVQSDTDELSSEAEQEEEEEDQQVDVEQVEKEESEGSVTPPPEPKTSSPVKRIAIVESDEE